MEQCLSIHLLFNSLNFVIIKSWKLAEWIFVDPATLHKILRKLDKSHYIFGSDFLGRFTHFIHLCENHGLGKHDVEVRWNSSENELQVLFDSFVLQVFFREEVMHITNKKANRFYLNLSLLRRLGNGFLYSIIGPDSLQHLEFCIALNFHGRKLLALCEYSRNLLSYHVLINKFGKDLSIINVYSSNILLVRRNLI